jgi:hypothetical protein
LEMEKCCWKGRKTQICILIENLHTQWTFQEALM